MKYKVTYEYRGKVTIDVEAENEEQAEEAGRDEAIWRAILNLSSDYLSQPE